MWCWVSERIGLENDAVLSFSWDDNFSIFPHLHGPSELNDRFRVTVNNTNGSTPEEVIQLRIKVVQGLI